MELEQLVTNLTQRVETLEKRQNEIEGKFDKTQEVMIQAMEGIAKFKETFEKAMELVRNKKEQENEKQ